MTGRRRMSLLIQNRRLPSLGRSQVEYTHTRVICDCQVSFHHISLQCDFFPTLQPAPLLLKILVTLLSYQHAIGDHVMAQIIPMILPPKDHSN